MDANLEISSYNGGSLTTCNIKRSDVYGESIISIWRCLYVEWYNDITSQNWIEFMQDIILF